MAETMIDWMTEARTRADATVASPFLGPGWQALHGQSWAGEHVVADESGHPLLIGGDGEMARADVDFAAHARQDLPRALNGVQAVLDLHRAVKLFPLCVHEHDDEGPGITWVESSVGDSILTCEPPLDVCEECCLGADGRATSECDGDDGEHWPCATVRAITDALAV